MKMIKPWLIGALVLSLATAFAPTDADAKRLGGGKSTGTQRAMPERTSPTTPPATQPAQAPAAVPGQQAAAPAAATPGKRSWLGPIAGLAAGLGIAALMSHLGLGEAFGNFLMLALLGVAVIALVVFIRRRMGGAGARQPALVGAGAGDAPSPQGSTQVAWPSAAQPKALAEPALQRSSEPTFGGSPAGATAKAPLAAAFVPATFDSEGFERIARAIFIRMQAANDSVNLDDLRQFTTPEMFAELKVDMLERGSSLQTTEVRSVDAKVVDLAEEGGRQVVSVRYRGEIVESPGAAPAHFDEVWHLVRPIGSEGGWVIAGIEQMAQMG